MIARPRTTNHSTHSPKVGGKYSFSRATSGGSVNSSKNGPKHAVRTVLLGLAVVLTLPFAGIGCASCEAAGAKTLSLMGGTINDPKNKSLRRGMMAFGLDRACSEMLKKPTPLREGGETSGSATNPTNGRFFPKTCEQRTDDKGDLVMTFSGTGYTYATGVHKVTFDASATVEFDQDFLMSEDTLYAYLRTKTVSKPVVTLKVIESPLPEIVNSLTGFGESYAKQLLNERLRDGMTIRRRSNSETDFRAGIVELGKWPALSFDVSGGLVIFNDRTEVHEQQRDFIGPIEIESNDAVAFVTAKMDGAPGVNVVVVEDSVAKLWQHRYMNERSVTAPPGRLLSQSVLRQGTEAKFFVGNEGKGTYWLVFDNSNMIPGGISPPGALLDDRAAVVSYAIAVGRKPR